MFLILANSFAGSRPVVGEKSDSAILPNAPGGPRPRNETQLDPNPGRSIPSGAEVYDVMKIETDPKTGKQHLVPVDKKTNP